MSQSADWDHSTRPRPSDRVGNSTNGVILPDHTPVQAIFHLDQLLHFAFQQFADWNTRPFRDDGGDVLAVNLFLSKAPSRCNSLSRASCCDNWRSKLIRDTVAQTGRLPRSALRSACSMFTRTSSICALTARPCRWPIFLSHIGRGALASSFNSAISPSMTSSRATLALSRSFLSASRSISSCKI